MVIHLYFVFKYNKLVVLKLRFTILMLVVSGGSKASTGVLNLDTLCEIYCKKKKIFIKRFGKQCLQFLKFFHQRSAFIKI